FHICKHPGTQLVLWIIKINANAGSSFHRVQSAINGTNLTFKLLARKGWERNIQLLSDPQESHFVLVEICPKPRWSVSIFSSWFRSSPNASVCAPCTSLTAALNSLCASRSSARYFFPFSHGISIDTPPPTWLTT